MLNLKSSHPDWAPGKNLVFMVNEMVIVVLQTPLLYGQCPPDREKGHGTNAPVKKAEEQPRH